MDKAQKIKFISNITDSIRLEIQSLIESNRIPENWDGAELKQLLAERFRHETYFRDFRAKRYKEYTNDCLINNL